MKTTAAGPAASQNLQPEGPVEVRCHYDQRRDEPVEVRRHQDQQQPAVTQQREEHGGYVYKPLGERPTRGTVSDLLEWAVPTDAGRRDECPDVPARDHGHHAAVQDEGVVRGEQDHQHQEPRQSTRAGKGETSKYHD